MKQVQVGDEFVAQEGMTVVLPGERYLDKARMLAGAQFKIKEIYTAPMDLSASTVETEDGCQFFIDEIAPHIIRDEYVTLPEARLPAPMREKPERGAVYYYLNAGCGGSWATDAWADGNVDLLRLDNGIFDKRWKIEAWTDHLRAATKGGRHEGRRV